MRCVFCALLLAGSLFGAEEPGCSNLTALQGPWYVNEIGPGPTLAVPASSASVTQQRSAYNSMRYSVTLVGGPLASVNETHTIRPVDIEMMRDMAARTYGLRASSKRMGEALRYTDAPGVLNPAVIADAAPEH